MKAGQLRHWLTIGMVGWAGLVMCVPLAFAEQAGAKNLPVPVLQGVSHLRVAYAENPRFAPLSPAQLESVLGHAVVAVQHHFGIKLSFTRLERVHLSDLFSGITAKARAGAEKERLDATTYEPTRERLARFTLKSLQEDGDIYAQRAFALPYLLEPPEDNSPMAFARALVATQHRLLKTWADAPALDGKPLLGADRFNEYTWWLALGNSDMPYDLILTNQLIASAEWEGNSVHSALRGGVSNGITTQSRRSQFKLYSVVSSFPFLDGAAQTRRLRGEEGRPVNPTEEASRQMGLMVAHELGHQLLHLGHPFKNPHCVMTPPVRLEFAKWANGLSAEKCPLGESVANTRGAVKFTNLETVFK